MKVKITLLGALALMITAVGCKKKEIIKVEEKIVYVDNTPANPETGTVELIFEPTLDGTPYFLNSNFTSSPPPYSEASELIWRCLLIYIQLHLSFGQNQFFREKEHWPSGLTRKP